MNPNPTAINVFETVCSSKHKINHIRYIIHIVYLTIFKKETYLRRLYLY